MTLKINEFFKNADKNFRTTLKFVKSDDLPEKNKKKVNNIYFFHEGRPGFEPQTCRPADQSFVHYTTPGLLETVLELFKK